MLEYARISVRKKYRSPGNNEARCLVASPFCSSFFFLFPRKFEHRIIPIVIPNSSLSKDNFNRRVFIKLFIESNWSFILSCRTNNEHFNCIEFRRGGGFLTKLGEEIIRLFRWDFNTFWMQLKRNKVYIFEEDWVFSDRDRRSFIDFRNKIRYTGRLFVIIFALIANREKFC